MSGIFPPSFKILSPNDVVGQIKSACGSPFHFSLKLVHRRGDEDCNKAGIAVPAESSSGDAAKRWFFTVCKITSEGTRNGNKSFCLVLLYQPLLSASIANK